MYKCYDCNKIFEIPKTYYEDLTPNGAFEGGSFIKSYKGCPICSGNYDTVSECAYCGEFVYLNYENYCEYGFLCDNCLEDLENEEIY